MIVLLQEKVDQIEKIQKKWEKFKYLRTKKKFDGSQETKGFITMIQREYIIDKLISIITNAPCEEENGQAN